MVYVNGQHLVTHAGGHLPFEAEVVTADDDGDRWCWWCWRCWWRWWWFGGTFPLRRRLSQHQHYFEKCHQISCLQRLGSFWLLLMRTVWLWRWTTPSAGKVKNTFDSKSKKKNSRLYLPGAQFHLWFKITKKKNSSLYSPGSLFDLKSLKKSRLFSPGSQFHRGKYAGNPSLPSKHSL